MAASNRRDAGPAAETQRDPRGMKMVFLFFLFFYCEWPLVIEETQDRLRKLKETHAEMKIFFFSIFFFNFPVVVRGERRDDGR